MYVCGITPYDATHIGHAATYVTFDVLLRALRDAGHEVRYVQNVTDIDDPLLARAARDHVDWAHLAAEETALYREDMTALGVIAPDRYLGVTESIDLIVAAVDRLVATGAAYRLPAADAPGSDVYLDVPGPARARRRVRGDAVRRCSPCRPSAAATPSGSASATRSTRCCGGRRVRASRRGTVVCSATGGPGGTSSAPRSRWSTSVCRSACRAGALTWSSRTTR